MTSGGGAAAAPLGKPGLAGMKHGPGGPWWGPGAPRDQHLAPPFPLQKESRPTGAVCSGSLGELGPGKGLSGPVCFYSPVIYP